MASPDSSLRKPCLPLAWEKRVNRQTGVQAPQRLQKQLDITALALADGTENLYASVLMTLLDTDPE